MTLGLPVTVTDEAQAGEDISDWIEEAASHIEGMDLSFLLEEILHAVKVSFSGINKVSGNRSSLPTLTTESYWQPCIYGWKKIRSASRLLKAV